MICRTGLHNKDPTFILLESKERRAQRYKDTLRNNGLKHPTFCSLITYTYSQSCQASKSQVVLRSKSFLTCSLVEGRIERVWGYLCPQRRKIIKESQYAE